jgi:hypothetical protein
VAATAEGNVSNWSSSRASASGASQSSASRNSSASQYESATIARLRAADTPAFGCRITVIRGSDRSVTMAAVSSVDPSSTTTQFHWLWLCATREPRQVSIQAAALKAGMTTPT